MPAYDRLYSDFDSELMRGIRAEAYGRDIGQHSWATADEVEAAIPRLELRRESRLLDIGCGPGGPLAYIAEQTGCGGVGLDSSIEAVEAAGRRVPAGVSVMQHDANLPLPFGDGHFNAVMAIDAVLHVRDRAGLFREIARVLARPGRLWFTDAAVLAGPVSNQELASRSPLGFTLFVPDGYNEASLLEAGFSNVEVEDLTDNVVANASGRIAARLRQRADVEAIEGAEEFQRQQHYLETVVELARRRALRRISYTASLR